MKPNRPRGASLMASIQKAKAAAPAPQAEREEANKWSDCEPKPEPREMTQTEYEVEYAKLCEKYRELLKFKVGAAPAETAGEMTAEQLAVDICRELYDRFVMGGWQPEESHGYVRDIAEAFAKQRVEQVERNVNAIVTLLYAKCSQKEWLLMPPQFHAAREKVADLERERRVTHIIVAQGEGAGVQLVTGEVHEELHKFMCCCGKRWENCETQDDIRRIDG